MSPEQKRAKFHRAVDRLMAAHGDWCYWRRTVPEAERERLAEVAEAAERTVMELYEAAIVQGSVGTPQP